jgi:hypothetical protein
VTRDASHSKRQPFYGISAYLESFVQGFVAQLITPLLKQLNFTLFDRVASTSPHLPNFTSAAGRKT